VTEAHRCEQLAQGCYAAYAPSRIWTHDLSIASLTLYIRCTTAPPCHCQSTDYMTRENEKISRWRIPFLILRLTAERKNATLSHLMQLWLLLHLEAQKNKKLSNYFNKRQHRRGGFFTGVQFNLTSTSLEHCTWFFAVWRAIALTPNAFRWAGQPLKLLIAVGGSQPPSNAWFLGHTQVYPPISISIGSATFVKLTNVINRHTNR